MTVLFVVCHPDDEVMWMGGLLVALSRFAFIRVVVVALSGAHSQRNEEFHSARAAAGYDAGVVLGEELLPSEQPLPSIPDTLEHGLSTLGLVREDIDVLVTHSPFGDEHTNAHHRQAFVELSAWTAHENVPFGYVSCMPLPFFQHTPLLRNLRRQGAFQVLNMARCKPAYSRLRRTLDPAFRRYLKCPRYYLQFQIDQRAKRALLDCYASIDIPEHLSGYAMSTGACESLYLFDDRAARPFMAVVDAMEAPGREDLFGFSSTRARLGRLKGRLSLKLSRRNAARR